MNRLLWSLLVLSALMVASPLGRAEGDTPMNSKSDSNAVVQGNNAFAGDLH